MAATGIRHHRERADITQVALAKQLGVDVTRMSRLENGDAIPTPQEVDRLAEILGTPPPTIFSKHILAEVAERSRETREAGAA